jgi:peptide subunit release factor RF-3
VRRHEPPAIAKADRFGGAIQLAGEVKARGERRRVRSDWMAVEPAVIAANILVASFL